MEREEQAAGEKRVRERLIDPLMLRCPGRLPGVTVAMFEAQTADVCRRLAYMSELSLDALAEDMAEHSGRAPGSQKDRFPVPNLILRRAAAIEQPSDTGSPLLRAVFAHALGEKALTERWAPEVLAFVKGVRSFPDKHAWRAIKGKAGEAISRVLWIEGELAAGAEIDAASEAWLAQRTEIEAKCRSLRDLGLKESTQ